MKLSFYGFVLQVLILNLLLANNSSGQKKNMSVKDVYVDIVLNDASIEKIFQEIESQTNYNFNYDRLELDKKKRLSLKQKNATVADVLLTVSEQASLKFKQVNETINVDKRRSFDKRGLQIVLADIEISGKITDENNQGLPGASVVVQGTSKGTTTDLEGNYKMTAPDDATLVVSFVGYKTIEVDLAGRNVIDIKMELDAEQLEEIVVVGYGTVKKSDITGSVSSVGEAELSAYPAIGAVQALQGRAAGVQVTSNNGEPGASFKVRIRGGTSINASSDPIYVVDGFVGAALPPPEDIASIEVLKDASATAIYGSRGANGVIMVTTKRGEKGITKVNLNVSHSIQNEINRLDLLDANQFVDYITETNPSFTSLGNNTDWQEEIFRPGSIQNYQLSVSGGSDDVNYYVSGTYFDQTGIVEGSEYDRFSFTSNIDVKANDKLKFGMGMFGRRILRDGVRTQEGSGGANGSGIVSSAFKFEPDQGIYDANGRYTLARLNDAHDNPVAVARERTNESSTDRFQLNFFGEYDIIDNLKFKSTVGFSADNGRSGEYTPTTLQGGANIGGDGSVRGDKRTLWLNENYLTYSKNFGDHDLTIMGGYSYQKSVSENWRGRAQGFTTDAGLYWNLASSSAWLAPSSGISEWELVSYYTRLNYSFLGKYLLTLNARYDGTSVFSEGNKYGFFPSGAVAWNMKDEAFLADVDVISNWKWRVSYGITGNRAIGPNSTFAQLGNVLAVQGGVPVNALRPTSVANGALSWESTAQLDIGFDVSLFNGRLNIIGDYYTMKTTDMLFDVPLPEYSGYGNQKQNIGEMENKGWELTFNTRNLVGELKWDMDFNISANRTKVLSLPDGNDIQYSANPGHMVGFGNTHILREGEPVGSFYGWIYEGVYQEGDAFLPGGGFEQVAGGERFADIDGTKDSEGDLTGEPDGRLNADDRTIIGNPHPDFIFGWNNTLSWKNFDMNIFFQGTQGNDIFSFTMLELDLMAGLNNASTNALNRWTPSNTNTDVPVARTGRSRRASTRFIYDGSFIRMKNISIGYNLPKEVLDKIGIQKLRVYVSGQNLLTVSDYEGYDPEVNYRSAGSTNSNRNLGLDYASYPNAKSVTFGLNLGF